MLRSIVATDSGDQLLSRQLARWFYDSPLAMYPMRFNAIEPRAFHRQLANNDSHPAFLFGSSVVSTNPVTHFTATVPRGIVPYQQQGFLAFLLQLFNDPHQKLDGDHRDRSAFDKPQPYFFRVCSKQPITGNRLRIGVGFLGAQLLKPQPLSIRPTMKSGLGQS